MGLWADKQVVEMSTDKLPVVIIRDDTKQAALYIPVREDYGETDDDAVKRANLIVQALAVRPGRNRIRDRH